VCFTILPLLLLLLLFSLFFQVLEGDGLHASAARRALAAKQQHLIDLRRLAAALAAVGQTAALPNAATAADATDDATDDAVDKNDVAADYAMRLPPASPGRLPLGRSNSGNDSAAAALSGEGGGGGLLSPATKAAAQEIIANAGLGGRSSRGRLATRLATVRSPPAGKAAANAPPPPPSRGAENAAPSVTLSD
jgi:hypothetical protein